VVLADHGNHLDATQDSPGAVRGLETQHGTDASFDEAVILVDAGVQILALPDPDRLQPTTVRLR
jgi:hypothetical protein